MAEAKPGRTERGRFAPGVSGNPAGRPVVMAAVRQAAADAGLQSVAVLVSLRDDLALPPAVRMRAAERLLRLATLTLRMPVNQAENFMTMSDQELCDRCPDVSEEEWELMRRLNIYQLGGIVDPTYCHPKLRHLTVLPLGFLEQLQAVRARAAAAGGAAADGHPAPSPVVCSLVMRGFPWE